MGFFNNQKEKLKNKVLKIIMPCLISIISIILIISIVFVIFNSIANIMKKLLNVATTYITNIWKWLTDDYWIDLSQEVEIDYIDEEGNEETVKKTIIDQYIHNLEELGISLKDLNLLGDADYSDPDLLEDKQNKAFVQKYIKSFVIADIITGQIHRRNGTELLKGVDTGNLSTDIAFDMIDNADINMTFTNEIDGGVFLYRTKDVNTSTGTEVMEHNIDDEKLYYRMQYKELQQFRNMVDKYNQDSGSNSNNKELEKYFAIDEDGDLLIAEVNGYTRTRRENEGVTIVEKQSYTAEIKKIDYRAKISQFSLPYEFLIDLCMVSQSPEFVFHVAQMSLNTRIDILLMNNETTVTNKVVTTETRSKEKKDAEGNVIEKEYYDVTITTTTRETSTNPRLELKRANAWSQYQKNVWTSKVTETKEIFEVPGVHTITRTRITNEYSVLEGQVIRKSDNFLGLLRNRLGEYISGTTPDFKIDGCKFDRYGINISYKLPNRTSVETPLNNLRSGEQILYSLLKQNDRTEPLIELMQYFMSFPEQEYYDLDEDEIEEILGGYGEENENQIGTDHIVKTNEPRALPAVSKQELTNIINATLSGKQKTNALSIVDTLINCQNKYNVNAVFVLAIARQESSVGTANSTYVKEHNNWFSWGLGRKYSSPQENVEVVMKNIATGSNFFSQGRINISDIGHTYCPNDGNHPTQGDDWVRNVTNMVDNMYTKIGVNVEGEANTDISNKIVKQAADCMKYLQNNGYTYPTSPGKGIPAISNIRNVKNATIDCSAYTSWVLYELGYLDGRWTSATFANNSKNWKKITNRANVKAGDIIVYTGHVEICAEDVTSILKVTKYNAGSTNAIKKSPYSSVWHSGFKFALRIIE